MNKLRVIIVEDEKPARDLVKAYLNDYDNLELVAECEDGFCGVKAINNNKPDLVFLDIQMPKLSGFEVLELLDEMPEVIFTTAFDQYAIKAFELSAVDYLMKPFSRQRFKEALNKVFARQQQNISLPNNITKLSETIKNSTETIERMFIKTGNKIDKVDIKDIIQIIAQDDYVDVITKDKKYLKKETMNYLEKALPSNMFSRVHRSHIININHINKIEKYGKESYAVILKDGSSANVSKSRIKELKTQLGI
jgi:two-component system LytT family response regulator